MYTRIHSPASAGAAKGHQALLRGAEDVVHNHSKWQYRQVFLQRGSREKMLTDGEAFPIRLGACSTPGSVSPLHPGEDWLPTPKAGRDPPLCGRSWI